MYVAGCPLLQCADEVLLFSICSWLRPKHVLLNIFLVLCYFFRCCFSTLVFFFFFSAPSLSAMDVHIYKAAGSQLH